MTNGLFGLIMDSMKAVLNQIPELEPVKEVGQSTAPKEGGSNLWAVLRRQKAQIGQIELVLSALKRDVNRIDRRQYREAKDEPPSFIPPAGGRIPGSAIEVYPDGLFN